MIRILVITIKMIVKMQYSAEQLKEWSIKHIIRGWDYVPIMFTEGRGAVLRDTTGKEYIDCTSQAWCLNLGHQHPKVLAAAKGQIDKIAFIADNVFDEPSKTLVARKLAEITPKGLEKSAFATSGSTAVEGAIQLAMRYSGSKTIMTLYHGYHGRTIVTIAASYLRKSKVGLERFTSAFVRLPNFYCYRCYFDLEYPDCDLFCAKFVDRALERQDEKPAGLLVEPVQGNGGQIPAPDGYLPELRKICDEHGVTLIFDEVQTGFGRCGKMFAADYYGVVPDIMVLGKAMGNGFPISAVVTSSKYDVIRPGDFAFTHSAHPVACAAALATMEALIEEKLLENAVEMGKILTSRLREMAERHEIIGDVRGPGLFIGVELVKDGASREPALAETRDFLARGRRKGVIFGVSGVGEELGNVIKIKPPLCITEEQAERVIDVFEEVLKEVV